MSRKATDWAFEQRGLKPSARVVLLMLARRHNPELGCFPSLSRLSEDCEMCRRAVQDQLAELQRLGFIRVEKMPRRGGRLPSNRYRLACEPDFSPTSKEDSAEQTPPKSSPLAKSAQGKKDPSPWANSSENLGQNLPPKLVSETKNKTRPQAPSGRMRWFCLTDDDVGSSGWGDWFLANNLPKLSDIPSLKKDAQRGEYMLPSRFPPTEREDVENALAYLANVGGVYPSPPEKVGVE